DATCDRISDGAVFCGLLWWIAFHMRDRPLVIATLICLVTSQVISYIKARAEASGLRGDGGFIERPERLIIVLTGAGVSDFPFVPWPPALSVGMWLLAVAGVITSADRVLVSPSRAFDGEWVSTFSPGSPFAIAVAIQTLTACLPDGQWFPGQ
ncbi:ESX secretion-associated protein EspG, partial [Neisseria meningitidis]|nr:ESX secretion-associated protein EspG [Neisseria meningitidis]